MSTKTGYSPDQVSTMIDVSPATLRRYAHEYAEFLSDRARDTSKRRRYTDEDIIVLKKIRLLVREKKTPDEIRQLIPLIEDAPEEPGSSLALLPAVLQEFENLRARLASQDERITNQNQQLDELRRRLDELFEERHQPWYRRLFRKKE